MSTSYVDIGNIWQQITRLWRQSPSLMATTFIMLGALVAAAIGIFADPRIITGVPAWLKPAKFAISSAIYSCTIAWFAGYLFEYQKVAEQLGHIIAIVLNIEVALICVQAARGTASHFNAATPLDIVIFAVMGVAIGVLLAASIGILVLLIRQPFEDATWGTALRLGMLITVLGSAAAGLMVHPTPEQLSHHLAGGHTVGALDGGPGLPGLGWSTEHGDLRIPHFFGLHAIQLIPFLAFLVRRNRRSRALVIIGAGSYLTFIAILAWQALRGESIIRPGPETLLALGLWLGATLVAAVSTRFSASTRQAAGAHP